MTASSENRMMDKGVPQHDDAILTSARPVQAEPGKTGETAGAPSGPASGTAPGTPSGGATRKHTRDHRVDALRGAALLMMFLDHIPQNILNRFTMRNFGFADAAEVFVLLAGYASWLAYGRGFAQHGARSTMLRIARRCGQLYVAQVLALVVSVATIRIWRVYSPVPVDFLEPELAHGVSGLWRVLTLDALPANLNILPLYMVLLACFPLLFALMRISRVLALVNSAMLWLLINFDPSVNFPNWLDPDGWYFDPLAWQFLFALGACAASVAHERGGDLPRIPWLVWLSGGYLLFSAIEAFPWASWGLPDLRPFAVPAPDKSTLAPLRLLDVLALFYLVQSSLKAREFSHTWLGQELALIGRHSLEVFTLGTILDLFARLTFTTFGAGWMLQVLVNVLGIAAMIAIAKFYDRRRQAQRKRAASQPRAAMPGGQHSGAPVSAS